jgi:methionyl-tRNA formyltransferase
MAAMSAKASKTRVIFMGSPDFALPTLRLLDQGYEIVWVVTQPDRPSGRGRKVTAPAVKTEAIKLGLKVIQPISLKDETVFDQLRSVEPDIIVVAAFGQILRKNILELAKQGCVNVHASLLPRWRGAAPIQAAILAGDEESGISIMKMDKGLDTGPILSQASIALSEGETAGSLSAKLAELGGSLLMSTLPDYLSGNISPVQQNNELATFAPKLERSAGELDFNLPALEIARKVRAYNPWPGTYFRKDSELIKVHSAETWEDNSGTVGQLAIMNNYPAVRALDEWVLLNELQVPGKRAMNGADYLRGAMDWKGTVGVEF